MRLKLRPLEKDDLQWILRYRNNPAFFVNFNQPMPLSYEHQLSWYENEVQTKKTLAYIITLNDKKVGYIALQNINWITRSAEISHFVLEDYSKDFIVFAHAIILELAFKSLNLNRIYSTCFEFNDVYKVLEGFGFKIEGTLRESCFKNGKYFNSYLIALLKNEYKNLSS